MSRGRRLFQYALMYKKIIIAALILLMISVSLELTGPFIAKRMIDHHILGIESNWHETTTKEQAINYNESSFVREDRIGSHQLLDRIVSIKQEGRHFYLFEEGQQPKQLSNGEVLEFYSLEMKPLIQLALLYFGLIVLSALFHLGQNFLLQTSANRIIQKMRMDVYAQIHKLHIHYFDNQPAGKIVSRITNDTEAVRQMYVTVLATFIASIIYITGVLVALFLLDTRLALICLIIIPILLLWIIIYRKFASRYNRIIRARLSDMNGTINESIQGMSIIQAFRREHKTAEEFEALNEDHFKYQNKLLNLNSLTSHNLVSTIRNIAFVVLIWYFGGASLGVGTIISVGVLYAFVDLLNRLFNPVVNLVNQLPQLELSLVSAERVFELMDEDGIELEDVKPEVAKGHVKFEQVSFAYKQDEYVLRNISFEARQGETIALVGHTGSGKSSIMNLLFRFYDVKEGRILVDGCDVNSMSKQQLRQQMGIVLQDPSIFTGTIASNISLNDPTISRETIVQSLQDIGAERMLGKLTKGIDEPVMEKGSTLSAGQRQLISFARALVYNPAILVLDEATASIDTETESIIQEALEVLKKDRTTFIIAHRLSTIKNANQILVLDHGEIVERGSHDELMQQQGRYYHMYQLQTGSHSA